MPLKVPPYTLPSHWGLWALLRLNASRFIIQPPKIEAQIMDRQIDVPIDQKMLHSGSIDRFSDVHRIDLYQSLKTISKTDSEAQKLIESATLPDVRFGDSTRVIEAVGRLEDLDPMFSQLNDRSDRSAGAMPVPTRNPNYGVSMPARDLNYKGMSEHDSSPRYRPDSTDSGNYNDGRTKDAGPVDCTDEYEVIQENRAYVAERLADANRALSDGDLTRFRDIFSDPRVSKADRNKFLEDGGEERIGDAFGSWIFGETKAQRDAVDAVRNGQGQEGDIKSAADEKLLACEARMLSEEVRAKEQQVEEQRQRKQQEQEESRVEKLIEDIPDIVREAALRGEKAVGVLFLGSAGGYADESLPQLDRLQQKVFDRLAELGLKPSIERMYAEGITMWVMTANW